MFDDLDLDPYTILGVKKGASAEEIRDAFHRKSKKHHPDLGGDEWAFRIVVKAHDALSQVVERERMVSLREAPDTGRIRAGAEDKDVEPSRIVQVEIIWMRYEVDNLLSLVADKSEQRNLSGSLNITWPCFDLADRAEQLPLAAMILRGLNAVFDEMRAKIPPTGARSQIDRGRFEAYLGYPSGQDAAKAFKVLRAALKARGLGVKQWTRDVAIPKEDVTVVEPRPRRPRAHS